MGGLGSWGGDDERREHRGRPVSTHRQLRSVCERGRLHLDVVHRPPARRRLLPVVLLPRACTSGVHLPPTTTIAAVSAGF